MNRVLPDPQDCKEQQVLTVAPAQPVLLGLWDRPDSTAKMGILVPLGPVVRKESKEFKGFKASQDRQGCLVPPALMARMEILGQSVQRDQQVLMEYRVFRVSKGFRGLLVPLAHPDTTALTAKMAWLDRWVPRVRLDLRERMARRASPGNRDRKVSLDPRHE